MGAGLALGAIAVVSVVACSADEAVDGTPSVAAPAWLASWTDDDPPERITRYDEDGGVVYLVTFGCCDRLAVLLAEDGEVIGSPSGGFTGLGDGTTTFAPATDGVQVWPTSA